MDLLATLSYLQIFWIGRTIVLILETLYYVVTGGFWDKTHGERDPSEPVGLLKFRKRVTLLTFLEFLWVTWIFWNAVSFFCWGTPPNGYLQKLMLTVAVPANESTNATQTLLASAIFLVHVGRRLYQSAKISIFSKRQTMGPVYLALECARYMGVGLTLVAEAPESAPDGSCLEMTKLLKWQHALAIAIFLWASKVQLNCHQTLARLRRNRAGHIVTTGYKIPKGHWFEHVSSPHYFAEVVVYLSIGLVLGLNNATWWLLVISVISDQFSRAYSTQAWYRHKFEDYPKNRKMFIPLLM